MARVNHNNNIFRNTASSSWMMIVVFVGFALLFVDNNNRGVLAFSSTTASTRASRSSSTTTPTTAFLPQRSVSNNSQEQHRSSLLSLHATKNTAAAGGKGKQRQNPLFSPVIPALLFGRRLKQLAVSTAVSLTSYRRRTTDKFRRALLVFSTAAFLWFGGAFLQTLPSHASAPSLSSSSPAITRVVPCSTTSVDKMVDRYVRDHMFDDDVYDPLESAYREAYDDVTTGSYPKELADVTSSVLGRDGIRNKGDGSTSVGVGNAKKGEGMDIGTMLAKATGFLSEKLGLSQSTVLIIFSTLFVVFVPSLFIIVAGMFGSISKRNMNRTMKERYGDSYTVDATRKTEEPVEAPDDDEDEDEDEDEDDNDDDDDDDDDE